MKSSLALFAVLAIGPLSALRGAEPPMLLWPQGAPGALGTAPRDRPTLTPYVPARANGAAMLLIPGGSYGGIYEGQAEPFARWLNDQGITAFVLRYRLGTAGYRYPAQLQDAVEAMRRIREQAARWGIAAHRVGAMGFSAGGHLLTTLLNHPEDGELPGTQPNRRVSPRPDLAVICYPVVSMIVKPHRTSVKNLLGDAPTEAMLQRASSERQVCTGQPPVFLWHTGEDKLVPVEHALLYAAALHEHGVAHELHVYQHGDHGTGLIGREHPWLVDLVFWLRAQGLISPAQARSGGASGRALETSGRRNAMDRRTQPGGQDSPDQDTGRQSVETIPVDFPSSSTITRKPTS